MVTRFCKKFGREGTTVQFELRINHSHSANTMAGHDDKKRKRAAEGVDAPNKKASSAAINVRFPAPRDELYPVIGMRLSISNTRHWTIV